MILLFLLTMAMPSADPSIVQPNLTHCGREESGPYLECHVDAVCLYGNKTTRETPMFLRRYYERFHGEIDISKCATLIVVRSALPKDTNRSGDYYDIYHADKEVRRFTASGWIDPAHFSIGVRFVVGQKIVMLSADDGFTDDDDWVFASSGGFPVFNGSLNHEINEDGKILVSVDAEAHDGVRHSHYAEVYRPRQHIERAEKEKLEKDAASKDKDKTRSTSGSSSDLPEIKEVVAQASKDESATPATAAGPPIFTIVICAVGAILACLALAGVVFTLLHRRSKRRAAANNVKTEGTQETEALIDTPETDQCVTARGE